MPRTFEIEQSATREEAAAILRDVADGVAGGTLQFEQDDEPFVVDVSDALDVEVEFEREDGEMSLEVEIEWPDPATKAENSVRTEVDEPLDGSEVSPVGPADVPESLARFEVFRDQADEWRWRMVHRNGNVIATGGEGYTRKHNAVKGLKSVLRNSAGAEVRDEREE